VQMSESTLHAGLLYFDLLYRLSLGRYLLYGFLTRRSVNATPVLKFESPDQPLVSTLSLVYDIFAVNLCGLVFLDARQMESISPLDLTKPYSSTSYHVHVDYRYKDYRTF
jgi:hypothetical protein